VGFPYYSAGSGKRGASGELRCRRGWALLVVAVVATHAIWAYHLHLLAVGERRQRNGLQRLGGARGGGETAREGLLAGLSMRSC
jgi:hypothetical protein